jgi:hypothetical protein
MNNDAPRRGASYSSAFSIILSLARERVAELGWPLVGENPKAFVYRGGLRRLETEAAEAARLNPCRARPSAVHTRSIHWPDRSARTAKFLGAASHCVSKRPI